MANEVIVKPEELAKIAEAAMAEPKVEVKTEAPLSPEVILPGGFIESDGSVVKVAEVRELNGEDEEAIAKASSASKALNLILTRGVVSIGEREVVKEDFDKLLLGDREALLLAIRRVTFGNELNLTVACNNCGERQNISIDLSEDVPVRELEDSVADRSWDVTLRNGDVVSVSLPNGKTQKKILDAPDEATGAELNTILLNGCINSVNGSPAKPNIAQKLGLVDREKITREIFDKTPGPRLGEVNKVCEACGENILLPLNLASLFRF